MSYPSAGHVEAALKSAKFWPSSDTSQQMARLQSQIAVRGAVAEWERITGWAPFLAAETASVRHFDGTDAMGWLDFQGGAIDVTSVTVGGQLLLAEAYWPRPGEAPLRGLAYTGIKLASRYIPRGSSAPGSIAVLARWGRVVECPGDAFLAIQQRAMVNTLRQIENLQCLAQVSHDGFSKAYDIVGVLTQKDIAQGGDKDFDVYAGRYVRVVC